MREIRRKDRILEKDMAVSLLQEGEYGFLAMVNADGGGYGIPLNYVYTGEGMLYFHCAPEGHKLDNIRMNNCVTFTVVGKTEVQPAKFSTLYRSVMAFGTISIVKDEQEKYDALLAIATKYSGDHLDIADKYIKGSFARTAVLRMDIESVSGKEKPSPTLPKGRENL